ncbi:hypothetical protein pdam_00009981 [Pocillopora damicornis]|uniref:Uncharacterized protein n=1 Tax=Pocillopora damicornis TaxID=46731 RepID=A0A3M6V0I4_POCDA|nr:hypothetical protein pdam_00009981 [Pocillopora damicornis]
MVDEELKKKRTTLEKEKALLDEFEPPLVNQLKTYRIALKAHVRALQALGIKSALFGKLLIPLFMGTLPPDMRLKISRVADQTEWELRKFKKTLKSAKLKYDELLSAVECVLNSRALKYVSSDVRRNPLRLLIF